MLANNNSNVPNEAVTACVYDENQSGVWLLFTKNLPEFVPDIDKQAYSQTLNYMNTYSSMRSNIHRFFDALKAGHSQGLTM
ncbi:MAG: hypothetical protein NWQ54_11155 [Paraglaciecola sp.]|uniref:hypothetical protein n=1 Tax=Pseudomonadati TaxID=3379134 RepID=UPI00273F88AA|nr:hypothetical protein [Paraglaciecola sp.]MDP5032845.1 hypothetical protein [Paraglaciecola sp.]MDP5131433.1 hypothetical protein [Paraglaciecola sp.]